MNKPTKSVLCVLLSIFTIITFSASPFCANRVKAATFSYPQGVSADEATLLEKKADEIIVQLTGKLGVDFDLRSTLFSALYADSTMNTLLLSLYAASEGQTANDIKWLDVTPQAVAAALSDRFPLVASEIGDAESWDEVSLDNAKWEIADNARFADAVGCTLLPFSDFLMTLLCDTDYKILGNIIKIEGNDGYEAALIPAFEALGCTDYLSGADFTAAAKADRAKLGANIILPLLGLIEDICDAPVDTLTAILPNTAYFIDAGGVESCIDELMSPINSLADNVIIRLFAGKSLSALDSLTNETTLLGNFSENLIPTLNNMLKDSGVVLPDIDWKELASCGTLSDGKVTADRGQSFIWLFRYLWKTLSMNKSQLQSMTGLQQTGAAIPAEFSEMLPKILEANADDVISLMCRLLVINEKFADYPMSYGEKAPFESAFAVGMTRDNYTRMLDGIDRVLYMAIADFSEFDDTGEYLRSQIFSAKTVWLLCSTVCSYIEQIDLSAASGIISLDFSPAYSASLLTEGSYASAKSALAAAASWASLKDSNVSWGFEDGDALGFISAVCAALRPVQPFLGLLLAGGNLKLLDIFTINGGMGYNNAIIPLLEALGCGSYAILTNEEYLAQAQENPDNLLYNILFPIAVLLDAFCDKPVKTLCEILPNIIYFTQNSGIEQCVANLTKPLTELIDEVKKVVPIDGFDMSALTELDISLDSASLSELMAGFTGESELPLNIDFQSLKLSEIGGMGTLEQRTSAMTFNGENPLYSYVKADGEEVLAYILRFAVETIKSEENSQLISSLLSQGGEEQAPPATQEPASGTEETTAAAAMDMTAMFSSSASGIIDQLKAMNTDETVCWLYSFFFREHTVHSEPEMNDYVPEIIYVDNGSAEDEFEEKLRSAAIIFCISAVIAAAVVGVVVLAVNKRRNAKKEAK